MEREILSTPIRSPTSQDERPLSRCSTVDTTKKVYPEVDHLNNDNIGNDLHIDDDAGWDTDLECEDTKEDYDVTGRATYIQACKMNGVVPVSYFLRNVQKSKIDMKHHGIGALGTKPIAIALVTNTCVVSLNMADNCLGPEGTAFMTEMLKENCYISELDLSQNQLGVDGAKYILEILTHNSVITSLTLQANDFDDKAAIILSEALKETTMVKHLDLSRNLFGEIGGQMLAPGIASNVGLLHLNLSWNHLRRKGAHAIANSLKENSYIKILNLSWNGFGDDGCFAIADALKVNSTLEELDLTNNRISSDGAVCLAKLLTVNTTLRILKVGKNPIQSPGTKALVLALKNNHETSIEQLELQDITVNEEFLSIVKDISLNKPNIKITHGGKGGAMEKIKERPSAMKILKNYIENNQMRLLDFFTMMDKDKSMSLTIDEFVKGLKETGITISQSELVGLVQSLDRDNDGEINYSELVLGSMEQQLEDRKQQMKEKAEEERKRKILTS